MKIGILHYTSPPVVGGVEAVIQAHARYMIKKGYQVVVFSGKGDQKSLPPRCDYFQVPEMDSMHPVIIEMNVALERGELPKSFELIAQNLKNKLLDPIRQVDVLIVHNVFTKHFNLALTTALFDLIKSKVIKKCIAWCHDISWTSPNSRATLYPRYPWELIKNPNPQLTYVTVSKHRRQELYELFSPTQPEIEVIYNGVEPKSIFGLTDLSSEIINTNHLLSASPLIVMPVRITRAKNYEWALHFIAALKELNLTPQLVVTGPPDSQDPKNHQYFDEIQKLRQDLDLNGNVTFLSNDKSTRKPSLFDIETVHQILRASDFLLMPSHREGFGLPIIEAGLLGIPVVATAVPAASEIAQTDIFVINEDLAVRESAQQVMNWLGHNPQFRLKQKIKHEFTWEAIFTDHIKPLLTSEANEKEER